MSFFPNLPTVVIVAADKGGVGKTTLSRVLLDYFKAQGRDTKAYDTESPKGNLVRFHKDVTEVVNLRDSNDQIKVFDSITREKVMLIDMRAGLLEETVSLLTDIGFFDLARAGKLNLAFMHIIGSTIASFNEIEATADKLAGINHYIVLNRTSTAEFFKSIDSVGKDALKRGTATIEVPMLDPVATEHVEAAAVPFGDFEKDPQYSFVMRGKVRTWENAVFAQLDALKLNTH
jgi:CobQ/CobB/MinD/ParA nucleotide binding domain